MVKQKNQSEQTGLPPAEAILAEARGETEMTTSYWAEDESETDGLFLSADGKPRRYWQPGPGETIHGYYMGCEVLAMPKFGKSDATEERAFVVLEVCDPPGYKGEKPTGARVKIPRKDVLETARVGDIVHVGVRARLRPLVLLSACGTQPLVSIRANSMDRTAKGFKLWGFDMQVRSTQRPSLSAVAEEASGDAAIGALFGAQDRGLYAARALYGMVIPERYEAQLKRQMTLPRVQAPAQIAAVATPDDPAGAIPANAGASA